MRQQPNRCRIFGILGVMLMATALASFGLAQSKPAPKSAAAEEGVQFTVDLIRVQLGAENQWEDMVKKEYLPALQKGGVSMLIVLRRATFGGANEYMILAPFKDYSELDQPNALVRGIGEAGTQALIAKFNKITTSFRTVGIAGRRDLGMPPPSDYQIKLVAMTRHSVAPGRTADFEKGLKSQMEILAKTNVKGALVSRITDGGDPNEYWVSILVDSFADLGKLGPAFRKAITETKSTPPPAGVVTQSERSTFQMATELSILPSAKQAVR